MVDSVVDGVADAVVVVAAAIRWQWMGGMVRVSLYNKQKKTAQHLPDS